MKISNLILFTATCIGLSACSSPEDQASIVAEKVCTAIKHATFKKAREYVLPSYSFWDAGMSEKERNQIDCTITNISQKDAETFRVEFKAFFPFQVREKDGEFKVKGLGEAKY
mgnify:FL=1